MGERRELNTHMVDSQWTNSCFSFKFYNCNLPNTFKFSVIDPFCKALHNSSIFDNNPDWPLRR